MADEPIPFTTGPLTDWPLVEEALEKCLDGVAAAAPDRSAFINWAKPRIVDGVKLMWQATQGQHQFHPRAFSSQSDYLAARALFDELHRVYKDVLLAAFQERTMRELYIADLEWQLMQLPGGSMSGED